MMTVQFAYKLQYKASYFSWSLLGVVSLEPYKLVKLLFYIIVCTEHFIDPLHQGLYRTYNALRCNLNRLLTGNLSKGAKMMLYRKTFGLKRIIR